jgi:acyl-CoA synthetase (AMP-forming)/AMP-acid ligase II
MKSEPGINLIHQFLKEGAHSMPCKCALVQGEARLTYGDLNREANQVARWLIHQGTVPGERVALLLENCREYVAGYYGILKAGGVSVPLNPDLKPEELVRLLARITPRAIISSAKCEKNLREVDLSPLNIPGLLLARPRLTWAGAPLSVNSFDEITTAGDCSDPGLALDDSALASIVFTSGSTGKPKGVMLSHRNIVANTRSIISFLHLTSADIQMVVLPFFYVMGKSLLNTHVAAGGTVVINNTFAYPASVVYQMIEEGVTGFSGVPSTYAYLLHRSPLRSVRDRLTSLRYCSQAGGHLARHTKEELLKVLPEHTRLYVMYGATEASARLTYVEPERLRDKIDSIGIPIPDVSIQVLDDNGTELQTGETGELVARGPNIMQGYWRDPESTAKVLTSHGYHTGDLGYRDEDGYFFVVGRKDSQLKVGGHRINPQEIEDALIATDLILECAVFGVEDALAGQRLVAAAVPLNASVTGQEILRACSRFLPRHKLPGEIRLEKSLPKNSSGKIDRTSLMQKFQTTEK